jgi:DnaJ-class molecular chaperone
MRWCPHCHGCGSSLKEGAERCTRCAGTGLVVGQAAALHAEAGANGSATGGEPRRG